LHIIGESLEEIAPLVDRNSVVCKAVFADVFPVAVESREPVIEEIGAKCDTLFCKNKTMRQLKGPRVIRPELNGTRPIIPPAGPCSVLLD